MTSTFDPAAVSCQVFKPITWSSQDTRPTQDQIVVHNAKYGELCTAKQ